MLDTVPFPQYISLKRWSAEFLRIYRNERLPILLDEDKWKDWANIVAGYDIFRKKNIPYASGKSHKFENWEDWAKEVYIVLIKNRGN